ncbi:hypothetical protein POM88_020723 [Heracleum sosnowskyi]|uniref:Glycine-rich protein n=1 Tax=Heracleum sosnowskyi TaxID=360622 RepID=A0AAD8ID61_9APIA|nr:hypothetical protein POM88_020723 [Heracleum sosnowskyi]
MRILPVLLLFFQLQHLHASSYLSSPLLSNPVSNKEQIDTHKRNMVKQETELKEKVVSNVNKRAGGGGGGGHGGHAGAAHGGSHGSSYGHGVGGGDSSVLPRYGGVVAGAGAGGAYNDQRNHHNNGKHSGVSSCCVHSYFQLLATALLLSWLFLL